jgi:hypothetical protein
VCCAGNVCNGVAGFRGCCDTTGLCVGNGAPCAVGTCRNGTCCGASGQACCPMPPRCQTGGCGPGGMCP